MNGAQSWNTGGQMDGSVSLRKVGLRHVSWLEGLGGSASIRFSRQCFSWAECGGRSLMVPSEQNLPARLGFPSLLKFVLL